MKAFHGRWDYPNGYLPYDKTYKRIRIVMIAPAKNSIKFQVQGCQQGIIHLENIKDSSMIEQAFDKPIFTVELEENQHYYVYIRSGEDISEKRLAITADFQGKVINYLHPDDLFYDYSGKYLCTPSMIELKSGTILVSMDVYKHHGPQNLTLIFRSQDGGENFEFVTELFPCFWGTLFEHKGDVYMLSTSTEYGDVLIGKSTDEGQTWSHPQVIMRGSGNIYAPGNHKSAMPIIKKDGHLYTTLEWGCWESHFYQSGALYIQEDEDLLNPNNWKLIPFQPTTNQSDSSAGGIEGNLVVDKNNIMWNLLRYKEHKMLMVPLDSRLHQIEVVDCPFGHSKFYVVKKDGTYYAVGNNELGRNVLSLYESKDLRRWHRIKDVVNRKDASILEVGYQYPSMFLKDGFAYIVSRTADHGAHNYHDSNAITFHKIKITG